MKTMAPSLHLTKNSSAILAIVVIVIAHVSSTQASRTSTQVLRTCPPREYHSHKTGECVECSTCPINQIIIRPCHPRRDTVCGPFYEFETFNHGPSSSEDANVKKQGDADIHTEDNTVDRVSQVANTQGPSVQHSDSSWRELCYGLIAALALVTLLSLLYVFITQLKAYRSKGKTITVTDPEDPTIYYQATLLTDTTTSCSTSCSPVTKPKATKTQNPPAARDSTQSRNNAERASFLQRLLPSTQLGNTYVDPFGRVFERASNKESTHPFVRVAPEARTPIYVPQVHGTSARVPSPPHL